MRIAITADPEVPVPPRHYGGIERIIDMLARELVDKGHDVTLIAHANSSCPVEHIPWPGLSSSNAIDTFRNAALMAQTSVLRRFDLIHSCSRIAYLAPILPLPILKLMNYHRAISPKTTRFAHRLSRGTLEFSAISKWMVESTPLAGRWHVVPNGVPLETFDFQPSVAADAPLVFLGRIEEIKGPHLAIEIAQRTGRHLVMAGNIAAEHQDWFATKIAPHLDGDKIRFIGPVDDRQKNELLGRAAAFLMPILWEEPFGLVMTESMACGTPVIALRRGAVPEVIEDNVTGYIANNVNEMVAAVQRIGKISRSACRKRVEVRFSSKVMADGYIQVYQDMIDRRLLDKKGRLR